MKKKTSQVKVCTLKVDTVTTTPSRLTQEQEDNPSQGSDPPDVVAVLDELQDIIHAADWLLPQPHHLHLLLVVLQHPQSHLVVQQVKHLDTSH